MNSNYCNSESEKQNPLAIVAGKIMGILVKKVEQHLPHEAVNAVSDVQAVKKQLVCTVSACFDKGVICCKVCDIKNCRYKCNFMYKKVCEHQEML